MVYYILCLSLLLCNGIFATEDSQDLKLIRTIANSGFYLSWDASEEIVAHLKHINNEQLERFISFRPIHPNEEWIRTDRKTYNRSHNLPADAVTALSNGWEVRQIHKQQNGTRHYLRPDGKQYITTHIARVTPDYPRIIERAHVHDAVTNSIIKTIETRVPYIIDDYPIEEKLKFDWSPDSSKFAIVDTSRPWDYKNCCEKFVPETVVIYQADNNFSETVRIEVPECDIKEISFSPESNWLAAYCEEKCIDPRFTRYKKVFIWNVLTGYLAAELKDRHYGQYAPIFAEKAVLEHNWGPDGKIALFNGQNEIEVYQLPQD